MKKITLFFVAVFCFAFTWQSNAQLAFDNTCTTSFDDISSTGVNLALTDDSEANITIPFAFTLDGVSSSNLRVANNGGVLFNATTGDIIGGTVATAQGFYIMQTDIDDNYGGVFWETLGTAPNRRVVILWNDRPHYDNSPSGATFEIILYETTNEITFLYQDTDFGTGNAENDAAGSWIRVIGANGTYSYSTNTALGGVTCINWAIPNCTQVDVATSTVIPDCVNSQFSVDVDVTTVGDATEVTDGTDTWAITGAGIVTVGPFAVGSPVALSVTHSDTDCNLPLGSFTYNCPPANDDCTGAVALTVNADYACGVVTSGTTAGATDSGIEPTFTVAGTPNNDVWFSFVATSANHRVSLTNVVAVVGTAVDMGIAVFNGTGTCSSLVLVGSSDPNTYNVTGLTPGTTYYVAVYGFATGAATAQATFDICVGSPPPPPANDNCVNAIALTVNADYACGVVTPGTTVSATDSGVEPTFAVSGTPDNDVWFSFVATAANHRISLTNVVAVVGTSTDMGIAVFDGTGTCSSLVLVGSSDPNEYNVTGLTPGTIYYVSVYGWAAGATTAQTTFNICVGTPPPPPANDNIANALPVTCGNTYLGSTALATSDNQITAVTFGVGTNGNLTSPNVWYTYTGTGNPEAVTLSLCNSGYDTAILVGTGTPGSITWVAGNDDFCGTSGFRSQAQFNSDGTTTYYIMVRGYGATSTGAYELVVTCAAITPPPANNECAAAEALAFTVPATGTTAGATQNGAEEQPSCDTFGAIADVWYSVTLAATSDLSISTTLGTALQANVAIYSACGGLAVDEVGCVDDTNGEDLTVTGLDAGTYYVRVWNNGVSEAGTFDIVADFTLSNPDINDQDAFTYYPNPVKNTLQLNAQSNIQNVSVYNMLGQEVLRTAPNNVNSTVDMSAMQTGAYFVKVTINDRTETVRVIKQ